MKKLRCKFETVCRCQKSEEIKMCGRKKGSTASLGQKTTLDGNFDMRVYECLDKEKNGEHELLKKYH